MDYCLLDPEIAWAWVVPVRAMGVRLFSVTWIRVDNG